MYKYNCYEKGSDQGGYWHQPFLGVVYADDSASALSKARSKWGSRVYKVVKVS